MQATTKQHASSHVDTGFGNVPGEEASTSTGRRKKSFHPAEAAPMPSSDTKRFNEIKRFFNNTFQAPPLHQMNQIPKLFDAI
jgi:hypothetical protein